MKKLNSIQFYGMPLPIYAFFAIIVLACAYFNIIPNQMIGAVAVLFARVRYQRLRRLDQRLQLPERLHHLPRRRLPAGHRP